jgi:hypothetical protein
MRANCIDRVSVNRKDSPQPADKLFCLGISEQALKRVVISTCLRGAEETGSQPLFRTFGACSLTTSYPRLAAWAVFLRRFAATALTRDPVFVQAGGCDTVAEAPLFHAKIRFTQSQYFLNRFALERAPRLRLLCRGLLCVRWNLEP